MPKFKVEHESKMNQTDTYAKVKNFLGKEGEVQKLAPGMKCEFNDAQNKCNISGPGFKAEVLISASGSGSKVLVNVDLGLLLTPLKGKVEETLKKQLTRHLNT